MKFSIITAVYNNKDFILDAINSVKNQTHKDIEHIVIDGNSKDGTREILEELYAQKKIAVFLSESDSGIYEALNKGIRLATGEIIGFLHSDDVYANDGIIERVNEAFERTNTESVYGDLKYVSRNKPQQIIRTWKSAEFQSNSLKKGWMPPHPTFFVRKKIYDSAGLFDVNFNIAADYELMLRFLGKYKIKTLYIPKTLVIMRVGGKSNNNIKNIFLKSYEDFIAIRRYKTGNLLTLLRKNLSKLDQFFQ